MGSWDGVGFGVKVKPELAKLAKQYMICIGVNPEKQIVEEVGRLSDSFSPSVWGLIESDLLGVKSVVNEHYTKYISQFDDYSDDFDDEYEDDEEYEDDDENNDSIEFTPDELFQLTQKILGPACVYLAYEIGNNTCDDYYRYEVIMDPRTGIATELDCYYSYGNGINTDDDDPKEDGKEEKTRPIDIRPLDKKAVDYLINAASKRHFDDLVQRLENM